MGANSKIEWTHHTFNPWIGCTRVHEGCTHCYAESLSKRTRKAVWGPNGTRVKTGESYWRQPLKWNREAEAAGERRRVFCASLADVFEDWQGPVLDHKGGRLFHGVFNPVSVPPMGQAEAIERTEPVSIDDLRRDLFALIDQTPWLEWLLLTKRPENVRRMWPCPLDYEPCELGCRRENVWLGTSVSNQETADRMVPELLKCRDLCPVLFLSAEPLLGPIEISGWLQPHCHVCGFGGEYCRCEPQRESKPSIDWLIVGGESGHGARPMHPDWARGLRDQCQAAGVPFFFKQWGEFLEGQHREDWIGVANDPSLRVDDADLDVVAMSRVGKAAAGRLLDGREWSEFPAKIPTGSPSEV